MASPTHRGVGKRSTTFAETGGASRALLVFPKCDTGGSLEVAVILILDPHPSGAAVRAPCPELGRDWEQVGRIPNFHVIPRLRHVAALLSELLGKTSGFFLVSNHELDKIFKARNLLILKSR